jgi:GNAT superfamily N-acetyltransferase
MENESGDLPQLAVQQDFRRRGLATALIAQLLSRLDPPDLRVINTCADSLSMQNFLLSLGMEPGHGQYEMILKLKTN